jgi:hypothetical protein
MESFKESLELFQFLLFSLLFLIQLFSQLQEFFDIHKISPVISSGTAPILSEAPHASARGIFTTSAKPAEAYPPLLTCPPNKFFGRRDLRRIPFRIHPHPSERGILRRRVKSPAGRSIHSFFINL